MFKGSITALITPFADGEVDEAAFQASVQRQIDAGTHAVVPCGTTGESPTLSHDEHMRVTELCIEVAKGRVPVIAGTGSNATDEAILLTRHAAKAGADAALIVTPYYNKPGQAALYAHYKAIHDAVDLPILIYNIPGRCVIDMSVETMARLAAANDFLVIDCPGSDSNLSRLGHARADTLITPMNDSFVDFDLLGRVDPQTYRIKGPSVYSEMVWESRKRRAVCDGGEIDWIVVRNRLSHLDAKNKRRVESVLEALASRIGFRIGPGFGERVIFREMFPSGLTLLDLRDEGVDTQMSMSHVAARAEVRALVEALQLPIERIRSAAAPAPQD
jgi:hypothetical protein